MLKFTLIFSIIFFYCLQINAQIIYRVQNFYPGVYKYEASYSKEYKRINYVDSLGRTFKSERYRINNKLDESETVYNEYHDAVKVYSRTFNNDILIKESINEYKIEYNDQKIITRVIILVDGKEINDWKLQNNIGDSIFIYERILNSQSIQNISKVNHSGKTYWSKSYIESSDKYILSKSDFYDDGKRKRVRRYNMKGDIINDSLYTYKLDKNGRVKKCWIESDGKKSLFEKIKYYEK